MDERRFKVVVLGTTGVGKTCLTLRFAKGVFDQEQLPTIGAAYMTKKISLPKTNTENKDGKKSTQSQPNTTSTPDMDKFLVEIWDTAGQERYEAITPLYYRSSEAAIIAFDLTSQHSFNKAKEWLKRLRKERPDPAMPICLAGNKADLYENLVAKRKAAEQATKPDEAGADEDANNSTPLPSETDGFDLVDETEVLEFVKENKLKYYQTSAKTGKNITEMFHHLALNLPKKEDKAKKDRMNAGLPLGTSPNATDNNCC